MDIEYIPVNGMKIKKDVAFAGDWGKVPVFTDENGEHVVDSTPLLKHIDAAYNGGKMAAMGDAERQKQWLEWVDLHMSKATVPILYGSLGSALKTTTRISKIEKFGFFSKRLYAWAGFPIMWGIIARKRVKKTAESPNNSGMICLANLLTHTTVKRSLEGQARIWSILQPLATCVRSLRSLNSNCSPTMLLESPGTTAWNARL